MTWIVVTSVDEGAAEFRLNSAHVTCYHASVMPVDGVIPEKTLIYTTDGKVWPVKEDVATVKSKIKNW